MEDFGEDFTITLDGLLKVKKKQVKNKYQHNPGEDEIDDPFIKKRRDGVEKPGTENNPYHCTVCNCSMNSVRVVKSHINGNRHIQRTKNRTAGGRIPHHKVQTACLAVELIKKESENAPVVGLDYVVEYHPAMEGEVTFDCELCNVKTTVGTFVTHIIGSKHRLAYLRTMNENKYYELLDCFPKKSDLSAHLTEIMERMEERYGRGEVTMVGTQNRMIKAQETAQDFSETGVDRPIFRPDASLQEIEDLVTKREIKNRSDAVFAINATNYLMEAVLQWQLKQLPKNVHQIVKESFNNGDITEIRRMIAFHDQNKTILDLSNTETLSEVPHRPGSMACETFPSKCGIFMHTAAGLL